MVCVSVCSAYAIAGLAIVRISNEGLLRTWFILSIALLCATDGYFIADLVLKSNDANADNFDLLLLLISILVVNVINIFESAILNQLIHLELKEYADNFKAKESSGTDVDGRLACGSSGYLSNEKTLKTLQVL